MSSAQDDTNATVLPFPSGQQKPSGVRPATRDGSPADESRTEPRTRSAIQALGRELHAHAHDPENFMVRAAMILEKALDCAYAALVLREGPSIVVAREPLPMGPDGVPGLGLREPPSYLVGHEGSPHLDPERLIRVPITIGEIRLGDVRLHGGASVVEPGDRERAHWLADMLAGPLVSERWASRARQLDPIDPSTGLANRRAFTRRLQEEIARSERYGVPLGLLLCRVDALPAGPADTLVKLVGSSIRASIRDVDLAARWSDESFFVLLPHQELEGAAVVARRIHRRVGALPLPDGDRRITVSVAAASLREDERAVELMERTYRAIDRAREAGGDRVELSDPSVR